MRHIIALSVFVLAVAAILATGIYLVPRVDEVFQHVPALKTHVRYTVQEIDGCEYIMYQVHPHGYERRAIHSGSCENHRD